MQDSDYFNNTSFLLKSNARDAKTQIFLYNFNIHSKYLINRYPIYLQTTKTILNNNIHKHIEELKKTSQLRL